MVVRTKNNQRGCGAPQHEWFSAMLAHFGPQNWWPARTRLEMIVGAILTQAAAWSNVEHAIGNLRREKALNLQALERARPAQLAQWLRPVGYFRVKTERLMSFVRHVSQRHGGKLDRMLARDTNALRAELLSIRGVGPETADSILLYAAKRPVFVIDAYTRRILARHGCLPESASYDEAASWFTRALPQSAELFNEYHALMVAVGKHYCHTRNPKCADCPLRRWLPGGQFRTDPPRRKKSEEPAAAVKRTALTRGTSSSRRRPTGPM